MCKCGPVTTKRCTDSLLEDELVLDEGRCPGVLPAREQR